MRERREDALEGIYGVFGKLSTEWAREQEMGGWVRKRR